MGEAIGKKKRVEGFDVRILTGFLGHCINNSESEKLKWQGTC